MRRIRNLEFCPERKGYVMGILNATPDSFSDGGDFLDVEHALAHAREMVAEGAAILDVGGESTRPGHEEISAEVEIARVVPVLRAIRAEMDVPISIDTWKSEVAEVAIREGADILNDVWGCKRDPRMAEVAARHRAPIILMQNRETNVYADLIGEMIEDLQASIAIARSAGVREEDILLDPGLGFALSYEKDLDVMASLDRFVAIGYPVLLGTSRKRFIGRATGVDLPKERVFGTVATTVIGAMQGVRIFRVHDVRANVEALAMTMAILEAGGAHVSR